MSVYASTVTIAGVPVKYRTRVKSWAGWPDDVRETVRRWNRSRGLSFRNEPVWGGFATGFEVLTCKCARCAEFFNNSGTLTCLLAGRWYCDDCIIDLARAAATENQP